MSIIAWIIVGALAGWLASLVMKTDAQQGCITDIIVGVIGAFVGGFVLSFVPGLPDSMTGINIPSIFVAFVGAVIFLAALRALRRR